MNKRAVTRKLESFNNKCCWYHETQDKDQRRTVCKEGLTTCAEERQTKERMDSCGCLAAASASISAAPLLVCPTCSRSLRRK